MSIRTIVVSHDSPVVIVTKMHPTAKLIAHVGGPRGPIRLDDRLDARYPPFVRAVSEWRCTDRLRGPDMHDIPHWSSRPPKGLQIMEETDEIRLTVMHHLFQRHVTVTVAFGRMIVTGESDFYTRLNPDPPAYE